MAETPVLCFPISGEQDSFLLLQVSSNGSRPLDLKLIACESTTVFLAKLRHKKIDECKASPGHCTDEEWQQILTSTLVDLKPLPDIEVRADVQSGERSVTLSFRKNIQGITQRLGSIKLNENEQTEVSLFDWCVSAIASRTRITEELADASARIESLEHSVNELKTQLEDFITTKDEDETQMLEKFRDLLNEKKLRIRQQQRLLAVAKVDPEKLANIRGGEKDDTHRNAGPSRTGKRKALVKDEEDESDDGFERMDVDKSDATDNASINNQRESGSDSSDKHDLSADNDATASDSDTNDDPPRQAEFEKKKAESAPGHIAKPATAARKQIARPSHNTRAAKQKQSIVASDSQDEDEAPPPPRTLPFMRDSKAAPPPKPVDDDETPSDDDSEL